jgi:hypothetical protein
MMPGRFRKIAGLALQFRENTVAPFIAQVRQPVRK